MTALEKSGRLLWVASRRSAAGRAFCALVARRGEKWMVWHHALQIEPIGEPLPLDDQQMGESPACPKGTKGRTFLFATLPIIACTLCRGFAHNVVRLAIFRCQYGRAVCAGLNSWCGFRVESNGSASASGISSDAA